MPRIHMTNELREQFADINYKATKLIADEVDKLSNDLGEKIVMTHMIIELMYKSDQLAISLLGLNINPVYKEE